MRINIFSMSGGPGVVFVGFDRWVTYAARVPISYVSERGQTVLWSERRG